MLLSQVHCADYAPRLLLATRLRDGQEAAVMVGHMIRWPLPDHAFELGGFWQRKSASELQYRHISPKLLLKYHLAADPLRTVPSSIVNGMDCPGSKEKKPRLGNPSVRP